MSLPKNLLELVNTAKKMVREETGLSENEKRFGMKMDDYGIKLTHKNFPMNEFYYTWEEIELEK